MNYIEVGHEYTDMYNDKNKDFWWAVRPSEDEWHPKEGSRMPGIFSKGPWQVTPGHSIQIWDQNDIDGIRKLLNLIEEEIRREGKDSESSSVD